MRSILIFLWFLSFYCNVCTSTKTVLFIYGDKNMTEYDVKRLSKKMEIISNEVFNNGSDFNFKIIFPNISYVIEIMNSTKPRISIDNSMRGQSVLKSLQTLLQECPDHSMINVITRARHNISLVITNAAAPDDVNLVPNILELIQIKRTEVNFIIPTKKELPATLLPEYKLITRISNGFIVCTELPKFGFELRLSMKSAEYPGSLNLWLKSVWRKINILVAHSDTDMGYCIYLDPFLKDERKEMILTRRTGQMDLIVKYSQGNASFSDDELNVNIEHPTKTHECVMVNSWTEDATKKRFSLRISGKSDFDIDYGFSTADVVRSLNQTRKRPITSKSEKVYVTSSNKTFQPTFEVVNVLFLNGTYFLPQAAMYPVPGTDLFVGSFEAPKQDYFLLQALGYIEGQKVYRLSKTAMNAADEYEYNKNENNSTNAQINGNETTSFSSKIVKVT